MEWDGAPARALPAHMRVDACVRDRIAVLEVARRLVHLLLDTVGLRVHHLHRPRDTTMGVGALLMVPFDPLDDV